MKQRILYLDVTKAIAITLVCIGHSDCLVDLGRTSVLREWIYSFHMPLFMLLCGYFSLHAFSKDFKTFIISKSKALLVPAIAFSVIELITCFFLGYKDIKAQAYADAVGGMWFLRTLFMCYVIVYAVKKLPLPDIWLCLLSITIVLFVPHSYSLYLNYMLMFFWAGYWLRKYYNKYEQYRGMVTIISLLFFLFCGRHLEAEPLTYDIIFNRPQLILWQLSTGLSGALSSIGVVYYICHSFVERGKLINWIGRVGTFTLGIYGVQTIIIERLFHELIQIDATNYPYWLGDFVITPIIGILSTIICYYLTAWLSKYKYTNLILFGGQYFSK